MSSRTCPEWPQLMEIAPELQFKHYTVREAQLPGDALVTIEARRPRRRRDLLRPRQPRLLRRAHRSGGRRGAARLALVRPARVGRALARRRRRLIRAHPDLPTAGAVPCRGSPTRHPGGSVRADAVASRSLPRGEGQEPARSAPPRRPRTALARAMLADVLAACAAVGPTFVVGPPRPRPRPRRATRALVPDPGGGQGAAVRAGLEAAAWRPEASGRSSSSTPTSRASRRATCSRSRAPSRTTGSRSPQPPTGRRTRSRSRRPSLFAPVYGPGSAARFAALAPSRQVDAPNLIDDVDTVADLERLGRALGPRTRRVLAALRAGAAA